MPTVVPQKLEVSAFKRLVLTSRREESLGSPQVDSFKLDSRLAGAAKVPSGWQHFADSSPVSATQRRPLPIPPHSQASINPASYFAGAAAGATVTSDADALWLQLRHERGAKVALDPRSFPQPSHNPFTSGYVGQGELAHMRYLFVGQEIFRRGPLVAQGGFSKIYNIVNERGEAQVARLLHRSRPVTAGPDKRTVHASDLRDIAREYAAMQAVGSPLLPTRIFYLQSEKGGVTIYKLYWLQRAYASDMHLFGTPEGQRVPVGAMRHLARTLVAQLAMLHGHDLVHRDLKTENVLYNPGGEIALADFGLVAKLPIDARAAGTGTLGCMAPEAYLRPADAVVPTPLDGKLDMFSLGLLLSQVAFPALMYDYPLALQNLTVKERAPDGKRIYRRAPPTYEAGANAAYVTGLYEQVRSNLFGSLEAAQLRHDFAQPFYAIYALKRAWHELDPQLGELVADRMLAALPGERISSAKANDALWAPRLMRERDRRSAAVYFDARLADTQHNAPSPGLSIDALRRVPRVPVSPFA